MNPSAILFDLDDTILTCEGGDHRKLWKQVIDEYIHHFDGLGSDDLYGELRRVSEEYWCDQDRHRQGRLDIRTTRTKLVIESARNLGLANEEAATLLAHDYHDRRENNTFPFEGAIETLEYLQTTSIKTALLTNGSAELQRNKINKFGLDKYFDVVLVEGEIGFGKPSPDIYLHAINKLKVSAQDSWIVGDNLEWEVRVPQKLGFFTIWNDFLSEGLPIDSQIKPDKIVSSIHELVGMLNYHWHS